MKIISISWKINITDIFNISNAHYLEQRAQKNITNLFDNKFLSTLLRKINFFMRVYIEMFVLHGVYIANRA